MLSIMHSKVTAKVFGQSVKKVIVERVAHTYAAFMRSHLFNKSINSSRQHK